MKKEHNLSGYYEFTVSAPEASQDAITGKLIEMGSLGFLEKDGEIVAYFDDSTDINVLCEELENFRNVLSSSGLDHRFSFHHGFLPEKDWNETWKQGFQPIEIGDDLVIVPSWIKTDTGRIPVIIDPGMAFGTGHHETTRSCLEILERLSRDYRGKSLLDVGTGTGVLAISAAKLGFRSVTGIDTDPAAVETALKNIKINSLGHILIQQGDISAFEGPFDVIIANLISDVLIQIADKIASRLNAGGTAVFSGVTEDQDKGVIQAAEHAGLVPGENLVDGKWVTLVFEKKNEKYNNK